MQSNPKSKAISAYFKAKREERGLTQEELSRFLGYSTKQIVSNWERGVCAPPLNKLYEICKILNLDQGEVISLFLDETESILKQHLSRKGTKKKASNA